MGVGLALGQAKVLAEGGEGGRVGVADLLEALHVGAVEEHAVHVAVLGIEMEKFFLPRRESPVGINVAPPGAEGFVHALAVVGQCGEPAGVEDALRQGDSGGLCCSRSRRL